MRSSRLFATVILAVLSAAPGSTYAQEWIEFEVPEGWCKIVQEGGSASTDAVRDSDGRLESATQTVDGEQRRRETYQYDEHGRLIERQTYYRDSVDPATIDRLSYSGEGRLTSSSGWADLHGGHGSIVEYSYDSSGRLALERYDTRLGEVYLTAYTWSESGCLTNIAERVEDAAGEAFRVSNRTCNTAGNVHYVGVDADGADGVVDEQWFYEYVDDRLVRVTHIQVGETNTIGAWSIDYDCSAH